MRVRARLPDTSLARWGHWLADAGSANSAGRSHMAGGPRGGRAGADGAGEARHGAQALLTRNLAPLRARFQRLGAGFLFNNWPIFGHSDCTSQRGRPMNLGPRGRPSCQRAAFARGGEGRIGIGRSRAMGTRGIRGDTPWRYAASKCSTAEDARARVFVAEVCVWKGSLPCPPPASRISARAK